jgi:hypothetical protein
MVSSGRRLRQAAMQRSIRLLRTTATRRRLMSRQVQAAAIRASSLAKPRVSRLGSLPTSLPTLIAFERLKLRDATV